MGCWILQRNRNMTSPKNSAPPSITASTARTTTGWSSTTPTSPWEAAGVPLIAFRLKRNRDSVKNWSKTASTCSTSFISSKRIDTLEHMMRITMKKPRPVASIYCPPEPPCLVGLDAHRAFAQPETLTIAAANSLRDALRTLLPALRIAAPGSDRPCHLRSLTISPQTNRGRGAGRCVSAVSCPKKLISSKRKGWSFKAPNVSMPALRSS